MPLRKVLKYQSPSLDLSLMGVAVGTFASLYVLSLGNLCTLGFQRCNFPGRSLSLSGIPDIMASAEAAEMSQVCEAVSWLSSGSSSDGSSSESLSVSSHL